MFCPNCGAKGLSAQAKMCPKCGHPININTGTKGASPKSRLVAFLLAFLVGIFGAHRFYLGKTGTAITQLVLTLTLFGMIISGIWALIDWIVILCGDMTDKDGKKVIDWDAK
ncbi:MAG: NINE protein [Alphaproteobacteria bacterium]